MPAAPPQSVAPEPARHRAPGRPGRR